MNAYASRSLVASSGSPSGRMRRQTLSAFVNLKAYDWFKKKTTASLCARAARVPCLRLSESSATQGPKHDTAHSRTYIATKEWIGWADLRTEK